MAVAPDLGSAEPGQDTSFRRTLAVVMHIDMVGYSRRIGQDDAGTLMRLRLVRRDVILPGLTRNGGMLRQTGGDSFLAVFDSIDGALQAALFIQDGAKHYGDDDGPGGRMQFRVGIAVGDVIFDETDVHGEGTVIAVRLETACPPGEICVARAIRDHARQTAGVRFEPMGQLALKNVDRPVEAFLVRAVQPAQAGLVAAVRRAAGAVFSWRMRRRLQPAAGLALLACAAAGLTVWRGGAWAPAPAGGPGSALGPGLGALAGADAAQLQALNTLERALVTQVAQQRAVPVAALVQILRRLGTTTIADNPAEVERQLQEKVDEFEALKRQARLLSGNDPAVAGLRSQAEAAVARADFDLARARLRDAAALDRQASEALLNVAQERARGAAQSLEESARVAAVTLNYVQAADDLREAAAAVGGFDPREEGRLVAAAAAQLGLRGQYFGDSGALQTSVALYGRSLALVPRAEDGLGWAEIQRGLGDTLAVAGHNAVTDEKLLAAIQAYHAALEVETEASFPAQWAATTGRLGSTLISLGELHGDAAPLRQGLALLDAAAARLDAARNTADWARTQLSIGDGLKYLSELAHAPELLERALAAYQLGQRGTDRTRDPRGWMMTELDIGEVQEELGERDVSRGRLEAARKGLEEVQAVFTTATAPGAWARVQYALGLAQFQLGMRDADDASLRQAVTTFRGAIAERLREGRPRSVNGSRIDMAEVLIELGDRTGQPIWLDEAIAALQDCLPVWTRTDFKDLWFRVQLDLMEASMVRARLLDDPSGMHAALADLRRLAGEPGSPGRETPEWYLTAAKAWAISVVVQHDGGPPALKQELAEDLLALRTGLANAMPHVLPQDQMRAELLRGQGLALLGGDEPGETSLRAALEAFKAAQAVSGPDGLPFDWAKAELGRAGVLAQLAGRTHAPELRRQSVAAYQAALAAFRAGGNPVYARMCEVALANGGTVVLK